MSTAQVDVLSRARVPHSDGSICAARVCDGQLWMPLHIDDGSLGKEKMGEGGERKREREKEREGEEREERRREVWGGEGRRQGG